MHHKTHQHCRMAAGRNRNANSRRLLPGTKVEVRSVEEGFLGSWHIATVISADGLTREVRYDSLLLDDGSDNLRECVKVSAIVDGGNEFDEIASEGDYRCTIRPSPPSREISAWSLHYGQCVDMLEDEIWWEGVILDHEDGSEERLIFFPDLGDERKVRVGSLRITQDWDELSNTWRHRGNWLFLEAIEEIEQYCPLLVSVKQIWYDVRVKGSGDITEWTSADRDKWKKWVSHVWCDNIKITIKQILLEFNSEVLLPDGQTLLELCEPALDSLVTPEAFSGKSFSSVPFLLRDLLNPHLAASTSILGLEETPSAPSTSPPPPADLVQFSEVDCKRNSKGSSTKFAKRTEKLKWLPVPTDELPEPELNLDAVVSYCNDGSKSKKSVIPKVKGHLRYLGWTFEFAKDIHADRMRFTCPDGTPYLSLREVCRTLKSKSEVQLPKPEDEQGSPSPNCDSDQKSSMAVTLATPKCPSLQDGFISSPRIRVSFNKMDTRTPKLGWKVVTPDKLPEPELDLNAVANYRGSGSKWLLPKVKSHLLYLGWKLESVKDLFQDRLRFVSPEGIVYHSIRQVCRKLKLKLVESHIPEDRETDQQCFPQTTGRSTRSPSLTDGNISSPERKVKKSYFRYNKCNLEAMTDYINSVKVAALRNKVHLAAKAKEVLVADGWDLGFVFRKSKIGKGRQEMRYYSPDGKTFCSLVTACIWYKKNKELVSDKILLPKHSAKQGKVKDIGIRKGKKRKNAVTWITSNQTKCHKVDSLVLNHGQESGSSIQLAEGTSARCATRVLRSNKRIRVGAAPSHHTPRNVFSLLIENNVILPRQKVHYQGIDGRPDARGTITGYGIECCCCECNFSISKFVVHAGGNCLRPAANIFLEDGRSMLDCLSKLMQDKKSRYSRAKPHKLKGNGNISKNDYICSVCHYGGNLVLCDQCPSSFHMVCLGLEILPEGDWFCPSCCCGICGKSSFDGNTDHDTNSRGRSCSQCERRYHVGCLQDKGLVHTESNQVEEWFCNMQCKKIYMGLNQYLGRPIAVGNDNLTWTLLKHREAEDVNPVDADNESSIETYLKLTVALDVMHECFEPLRERLTKRDIVEDVIFCKRSNLNRINFRGFYTVLLEKNDEVVSVATIRVHGEKVAEVPLIATRFQFRRHGMCRILMDELEKVLVQLGVERLVLPAAPSVLSTWMDSFGFSKVKKSERLNFLDYTFLDFQGTVMCQKVLKEETLSSNLNPGEGPIKHSCSNTDAHVEMDLDGNSGVSEVYQTDRVEDGKLIDHQSTEAREVSNCPENIASSAMTKQPEDTLVEVSAPLVREDKFNGGIICYKRRKMSASRAPPPPPVTVNIQEEYDIYLEVPLSGSVSAELGTYLSVKVENSMSEQPTSVVSEMEKGEYQIGTQLGRGMRTRVPSLCLQDFVVNTVIDVETPSTT